MTMHAVVIGCGWIGSEVADDPLADGIQSHAGAYRASKHAELVGVCDADRTRADRAARRWEVAQSHTSVRELLLACKPQIVSVCTPDATHASVLREVLDHDGIRAIVAEKPLALDLNEAREIVALAKSKGITLAVNYSRRFAPSHQAVRQRIRAGELGDLIAVQGYYGKGIAHNGTHWFDMARWMVGEVDSVQAWDAFDASADGEPTCNVRLEFSLGQSGVLLGVNERRFTIFEMQIVGTKGRVSLADSGMRVRWSAIGPSPLFSGYTVLQPEIELAAGFRDVALLAVDDAIAAVQNGSRPACSGEDGVAALAIADAVRRSLITKSTCAVLRM